MHPLIYVPSRSLVVPDRAPRRLGCGCGMGVGGAPPPWTPAALGSTLIARYVADSGVILTDGAVSQWSDLTGHGYHLTQSTATKRPTVQSASLGGRDVIRGDGVDDVLANASNIFPGDTTTMAIVLRTIAGKAGVAISQQSAGGNQRYLFYSASASAIQRWSVGPAAALSAGVGAVLTYTATGVNEIMRKNGVQTGSTVTRPSLDDRKLRIFDSGTTATFPWAGDIAEILICDTVLDAATLSSLETYLMTAWGIS